jgi:type I restriction enzyme M protein
MSFPRQALDRWKDITKDGKVGIVGYEIPGIRYFHVFEPPRSLAEIDADLKACTGRMLQMPEEVAG